MKRTSNTISISDAINCSVSKDFTTVPNELIRNPALTAKAKTILCILLSNRDGWKSYISSIKQMMKEQETAITSGIQELEAFGYLRRLRYRCKEKKVWRGSFWAYTDKPGQFVITEQLTELESNGLEVYPHLENPHLENPHLENPHLENPHLENPHCGKPTSGKSRTNNINNKNTNINKTNNKNTNINKNGFFEVKDNWDELLVIWLQYKLERKQPYKSEQSYQALRTKIRKLSKNDKTVANQIIKQSMANNWAGLFELAQPKTNGVSFTTPTNKWKGYTEEEDDRHGTTYRHDGEC